jgi:hypothetical protein
VGINSFELPHYQEIESQIETLESTKRDTLRISWPAEILSYLSNRVYQYMTCYEAWSIITKGHLVQILDTTRNRLLTFILELADRYPEQAKASFDTNRRIPDEQIRQVFNYYIMGGAHHLVSSASNVSQGGTMAIFDQRNQQVNYQYNAAGNINFDNVQNRVDLVGELEKLKAELATASAAGVIDGEIVTDAEYQITKAIQQSQKAEPNKTALSEHLQNAKSILEGVTSAAGMVTALAKAIELIQTLF